MAAFGRLALARFLTLLTQRNTADVFQQLMMAICVIAGVAHLSFIMVFNTAGVGALARINMASVLMYALAGLLVQHRRPVLAITLMALEIVCHGILAVVVIGWDSGFHYYIILIIPVAIVSSLTGSQVKALVAVGTALLYMGLDLAFRGAQPMAVLPSAVLNGLHYFNLASTLLILGLLAMVYYRLVCEAQARLHEQACTDPLTQLRNRRFAMEAAQHEAAVSARGGRPLALVLGDVDHFKRINDQHGHETGDLALQSVAQALREGVRQVDHVARWGGEEFLMLLPATDQTEALHVAERLRTSVQALDVRHQNRQASLSITLGVAILGRDETVAQALARADKALYQGKADGRNRVVLAARPQMSTQAEVASI